MNTRALLPLACVLAFTSTVSTAAHAGDVTVDFYAGQSSDVGDVWVGDDGSTIEVAIDTSSSGWTMDVTHVYVGLEDPEKAAPGRFPYAHEGLDAATYDSYSIDLADIGAECGDSVVVAVHAEVEQFLGYEDADLVAFAAALPETVDFQPRWYTSNDSYWDIVVSDETSPLAGTYDGWCVDTDNLMDNWGAYTGDVYSTLDSTVDFSAFVEHPEHLDELNYLINQDWQSMTCAAAGRNFTMGDMQRAMWALMDDEVATGGLRTWSQACANEIYTDAVANGSGFTPTCDQDIAVMLVPTDDTGAVSAQVVIGQVTVAEVGLDCDPLVQGETAWGGGDRQFDTGWGWMIDTTITACESTL